MHSFGSLFGMSICPWCRISQTSFRQLLIVPLKLFYPPDNSASGNFFPSSIYHSTDKTVSFLYCFCCHLAATAVRDNQRAWLLQSKLPTVFFDRLSSSPWASKLFARQHYCHLVCFLTTPEPTTWLTQPELQALQS